MDLGLPPACVDAYIAEVSKAPPPALVQVVRAILDSDDWPEAVKVFGTGNPDPNEWGFDSALLRTSIDRRALSLR